MGVVKFYLNKDKSIMCPKCGKFMGKYDKTDPTVHKLACKHCRKWIWFIPADDDYREIKKIPERMSSSGMDFY